MRMRRVVQRHRHFNYDYKTFLLELRERGIPVGGCGGKKQRLKAKVGTIDANFNSIGNAQQQQGNLELVTKLMGEIGSDGACLPCVDTNDRLFLNDCRIKMNQGRSTSVFGWRQIANVVRIHKAVTDYRAANATQA